MSTEPRYEDSGPQTCHACRGCGTTGRDAFGKPMATCNLCGGAGEIRIEDDIASEAWAVCPMSMCGGRRLMKRMYSCGTIAMGEPLTGMIINPGPHCTGDELRFTHDKITVGKRMVPNANA